ncbi:hypothetical protein KRX19_03390 [Cardiobacteriaceae bacterium TAE3-ERU3]|nr:hypothetical protein [Cardiobacteriaceae bacterium TAE3-ERU3]
MKEILGYGLLSSLLIMLFLLAFLGFKNYRKIIEYLKSFDKKDLFWLVVTVFLICVQLWAYENLANLEQSNGDRDPWIELALFFSLPIATGGLLSLFRKIILKEVDDLNVIVISIALLQVALAILIGDLSGISIQTRLIATIVSVALPTFILYEFDKMRKNIK